MQLKTRITFGACAALFTLALGFTVTGQISEKQVEARFQDATLNGKAVLWTKIASSQVDRMQAGSVPSLTRNRDALAALQQGNLEDLYDEVLPTYNRLSTGGVLDRLTVVDIEGGIAFAEPEVDVSTTSNGLLISALEDGEFKRGLIRDNDGALVTGLAFPLYVRGELIGAALFSREIQPAIEDFKVNDGGDLVQD